MPETLREGLHRLGGVPKLIFGDHDLMVLNAAGDTVHYGSSPSVSPESSEGTIALKGITRFSGPTWICSASTSRIHVRELSHAEDTTAVHGISDTAVLDPVLSTEVLQGEMEARETAIADLQGQIDGLSVIGYVAHGSDAATARPAGYATVLWHGSVAPTNGAASDIWVVEGSAPSGGGGGDLAAHLAATADVHGIVDTAQLVYTNDVRLLPVIESVPKTGAYTATASDIGKSIDVTVSDPSSATITIPANLGQNGSMFEVCQRGTGAVDFVGSGGVTFESIGNKVTLDNQGAVARFRRLSGTLWHIGGDLS